MKTLREQIIQLARDAFGEQYPEAVNDLTAMVRALVFKAFQERWDLGPDGEIAVGGENGRKARLLHCAANLLTTCGEIVASTPAMSFADSTLTQETYGPITDWRDSARVECPHCKRPPDAVNHVPGHIFVGWGHGWQPCIHCDGTQLVPN